MVAGPGPQMELPVAFTFSLTKPSYPFPQSYGLERVVDCLDGLCLSNKDPMMGNDD